VVRVNFNLNDLPTPGLGRHINHSSRELWTLATLSCLATCLQHTVTCPCALFFGTKPNQTETEPKPSELRNHLIAFRKKDAGLRSIAIGLSLCRLVACAACAATQLHATELLAPNQPGLHICGSAEAAVHSVRRFMDSVTGDFYLLFAIATWDISHIMTLWRSFGFLWDTQRQFTNWKPPPHSTTLKPFLTTTLRVSLSNCCWLFNCTTNPGFRAHFHTFHHLTPRGRTREFDQLSSDHVAGEGGNDWSSRPSTQRPCFATTTGPGQASTPG